MPEANVIIAVPAGACKKQYTDLIGKKFNRLTIVGFLGKGPHKPRKRDFWFECQCECGNLKIVSRRNLTRGRAVKSCGCIVGLTGCPVHQHTGRTKRTLNATWKGMRKRCCSWNRHNAKNYHDKGIAVCERWTKCYWCFADDMGPRPTPNHTIERIKNEIGYSPENCRWATRTEQNQNQGKNVILILNGERVVMAEAARRIGGGQKTLAEAVERARKRGSPNLSFKGVPLVLVGYNRDL